MDCIERELQALGGNHKENKSAESNPSTALYQLSIRLLFLYLCGGILLYQMLTNLDNRGRVLTTIQSYHPLGEWVPSQIG